MLKVQNFNWKVSNTSELLIENAWNQMLTAPMLMLMYKICIRYFKWLELPALLNLLNVGDIGQWPVSNILLTGNTKNRMTA